ncbi:ATP-binding protein [Stackebrandtia nassauensis]|uniref:NB-ARC domain-containing protein n=1 Tax=Stackebrandtia nassauensis (strain DSM 44728 / CIP 108903 / NRRL B-16338 / NBRC 102104 / LLR-40K-21) TaxID=446470 RepID=D3Q472_STANL|nr:ATP-binding protein [Stackebrandtia nassauensis]ADD45957.1 hypothetical protein Snas_6340 [Stackebrandtia nassauensis DSM 44728]
MVEAFFGGRWAGKALDRVGQQFRTAVLGTEVQRALVQAVAAAVKRAAEILHGEDEVGAENLVRCLMERDSRELPLVDGTRLGELRTAVGPWVRDVFVPVNGEFSDEWGDGLDGGQPAEAHEELSTEIDELCEVLSAEIVAAVRENAETGGGELRGIWSGYQYEVTHRQLEELVEERRLYGELSEGLWIGGDGVPARVAGGGLGPSRIDYGRISTSADHFVGRVEQLAELESLRASGMVGMVCSVGGFGGVGKTALVSAFAKSVADEYPDGLVFVDFQSYPETDRALRAEDVLPGLLKLGCGMTAPVVDRMSREEQFASWHAVIDGRRMIFLWDNVFEDEQIEPLRARGEGSLTLITSRNRFHVDGARMLDLDVLPLSDAVAMFAEIAGADRCGDVEAVKRIANACDRVPVLIGAMAAKLMTGIKTLSELDIEVAELPDARTKARVFSILDDAYLCLSPIQQEIYELLGTHPGRYLTVGTVAVMLEQALGHEVSLEEAVDALDALVARRLADPHRGEVVPEGLAEFAYTAHDVILDHAQYLAVSVAGKFTNRFNVLCAYYGMRLDEHRENEDRSWFIAEHTALLAVFTSVTDYPEVTMKLGNKLDFWGAISDAKSCFEHVYDIYREAGNRMGEAEVLVLLGAVSPVASATDDPVSYLQRAYDIYLDEGEVVKAINCRLRIAMLTADDHMAISALGELSDLFPETFVETTDDENGRGAGLAYRRLHDHVLINGGDNIAGATLLALASMVLGSDEHSHTRAEYEEATGPQEEPDF